MKLVIKPHRPVRKALISIALAGAVAIAFAIAMDYGHWKSIAAAMVSTGTKRSLLEESVRVGRENESLRDEIARFRRLEAIDSQARKDTHAELVRLQSTIAVLEAEVGFYRDILGGTEASDGPRVQGVRIKALQGEGRYGYKLVMTHVNKGDRMAEGNLTVDISGDLKGRKTALPFSEIVESGPESLAFKFKHFHLFEGTVRTPPGFIPRQIRVDVATGPRRKNAHTKTYDWVAVLD